MKIRKWTIACILPVLLLFPFLPALAEESAEVQELKSALESLQKTVQALQARLDALEREKAATLPPGTAPAEATPPVVPGTPTVVPDYNNILDQQIAAPRPENAPLDPALKGFIQIPGTQSMIKPGGSARLDTIGDFAENGNPNMFVPSSIPVEGQSGYDGNGSTALQAKGTRIHFEYRRPLPGGENLKIYYENDFFNDSSSSSMSYRLRHFYGQGGDFLVGQTFSTFMNIDSWPDTVDYQGPNAIVNRRIPQVRYITNVGEGQNISMSIEQPSSEIETSASGFPDDSSTLNRYPDFAIQYRFERKAGHFQTAGLLRSIAYDSPAGGESVFGWGLSVSGAQNVGKADKFTWQVAYGEGMARYVNDTNGLDLDAALDETGDLDAIPVFSPVVGYTHAWSEKWRSTLSYGYVEVDPLPSLGEYALQKTQYASVNLIWQPVRSARFGIEYLYGTRETQGGWEGDASRINFVFKYDLVK